MSDGYAEFIASKVPTANEVGPGAENISGVLYGFQRDITDWACRKGRAAIWADCGMGKTLMQLEWARQVTRNGGKCLIVSPLGVAEQTIREADKLGMTVVRVAEPSDDQFQITNYQKLHHFISHDYVAIVLDESSILKSIDGKTRTLLLQSFTDIAYRLCCTATPAPNDISELANHCEFLGVMSRVEMLASFFVHDDDGWRLKGHAVDSFWQWVATWGVFIRKPSDLGYPDDGFDLPPLHVNDALVPCDFVPEGQLFAVASGGIVKEREARRASMSDRVALAAEIIGRTDDQWVVWCGLNDEGRSLAKTLGQDAALIEGADDDDAKVSREVAWRNGRVKVLITKPQMFGFGLNWQHCHNVLFLGISHSYEQYYQAIRRCWRFGQSDPVNVVIVVSDLEAGVAENVRRKEREASRMSDGIVEHMAGAMREEVVERKHHHGNYVTDLAEGDGWRLHLGDCVERLSLVPDQSVGLSVFSPPFASLYTYSASERDMGNSKDYDQFFRHFKFLIGDLLRVTMPGRRSCVHVQQVTTTKATHGQIGWRDFRADVVRNFIEAGWVYDGEVVIDKDPQAQAIRTKSKALMFVQKNKDSAWSRPAMADYILLFRAPGDNLEPVKTDVNNEEWIMWARPIWYNIRESDTLNATGARNDKDERHICPLQLGTIERCVRLWSNRGDTVLSPFAGIGSEGYVSLKHGRKFIGIELKPEYWRVAQKNLNNAVAQMSLL